MQDWTSVSTSSASTRSLLSCKEQIQAGARKCFLRVFQIIQSGLENVAHLPAVVQQLVKVVDESVDAVAEAIILLDALGEVRFACEPAVVALLASKTGCVLVLASLPVCGGPVGLPRHALDCVQGRPKLN